MTRQTTASTGHFAGKGGLKLHYRFDPAAEPVGTVVVVHGFAEHCGRYDAVVAYLNGQGFDTLRFDCRGHGQSDGRRAYVERYRDYLDDLDAAVARAIEWGGPQPLFLLGHSQGGLIVAAYALQNPEGIDGLVLTSPAIRFAVKVNPAKAALGKFMSLVWPTLSLPSGIAPDHLSHDPAVGEAYAQDPLVSSTATARWYTESLRTQRNVQAQAGQIRLPTLVLQAGADRLVDPAASRAFYQSLGTTDRQWQLYEGFYHEILNEVERHTVLDDIGRWLHAHR